MFLAGDEFLNTQFGNNNAYCQDNEISWLDWELLKKNEAHFAYTKHVIKIRKEHDVVRKRTGNCSLGFPEVQVAEPDEQTKVLRVIYAGRNHEDTDDDVVLLAVNVFWEPQEFLLPQIPSYMRWQVIADSFGSYLPEGIPGQIPVEPGGGKVYIGPRSVLVLTISNRNR